MNDDNKTKSDATIAERIAHLETLVETTAGQVKDLHNYLLGEKLKGRAGLVDMIDEHRRELFGDTPTRYTGLSQKFEDFMRHVEKQFELTNDRVKRIQKTHTKHNMIWGAIVIVAGAVVLFANFGQSIKDLFK